jgi:hypothetical protein
MPPGSDRITVEASVDSGRGWLVIQIEAVGFSFDMSLAFFPQSRMSQDAIDFLGHYRLVTELGHGRYLVRGITLGGMPVANLEVVASAQLTRVQLDGMLRADFLKQFSDISLDPSSFTLTFVDP